MITIINYGLGNLGSVQNMLKRIGAPCNITSYVKEIADAERILLPGVGAFDSAIQKIDELNLRSVLVHKAKVDKSPFLGICLGMQLLTRSSEE
jgi:glutamine amidotransferase